MFGRSFSGNIRYLGTVIETGAHLIGIVCVRVAGKTGGILLKVVTFYEAACQTFERIDGYPDDDVHIHYRLVSSHKFFVRKDSRYLLYPRTHTVQEKAHHTTYICSRIF